MAAIGRPMYHQATGMRSWSSQAQEHNGTFISFSKAGGLAIKPEVSGILIVKGHSFQGEHFRVTTEGRAEVAR